MAFASPTTAGLGAADGLAGGAAVDCVVAAGSYESTVSWRTAPTVAARSRHCDSGHADGEAEGVGEGGGVEGDGFAAQATNRHAARAENTAGVAFMGSRYPASLVGPAAARQRALPWLRMRTRAARLVSGLPAPCASRFRHAPSRRRLGAAQPAEEGPPRHSPSAIRASEPDLTAAGGGGSAPHHVRFPRGWVTAGRLRAVMPKPTVTQLASRLSRLAPVPP